MSSGRFQSQTFNWLNQQRLRWNDRWEQGWRSVQLGMTWGLQIALYPFYAAVQSSRLLLRQWHSRPKPHAVLEAPESASLQCIDVPTSIAIAVPDDLPTLPPVDLADRFLASVQENFAFKVRSSSGTEISTLPTLRGIACLRIPSQTQPPRSLVWVDDRNQLWTVPPAQQQALQYQILTLLVKHTPQPDRLRVSIGSAPLHILPDRPQQLPPVRWFRRLLNWMHTSPIALSTNIFQEARLRDLPPPPFPNPLPAHFQDDFQRFSLEKGDALIRFLDYHLALWEPSPQEARIISVRAHPPAPVANPIKIPPLPSLSPFLEEVRAFQGGCTDLAQEIAAGLSLLTAHLQKKVLKSWFNPGAIAITRKPSDSKPFVKSSLRTIPELFPNDLPEINLPGINPPEMNRSPINLSEIGLKTDQTNESVDASSSRPFRVESAIKPLLIEPIGLPESSSLSLPRNASVLEWDIEPAIETIAMAGAIGVSINPEPCPEIEVKSLTVGYVKHPLEQLLHWLDRLVTWVENQLARLWRAKE